MRIVSTLTAIVVLAAIPSISQAQAPATPGGMDMKGGATDGMKGGGMMGGDMSRMMAMMHGGMMGDMPLKHIEGRLAFLKVELKITATQEPQWTKFADVVRSTAKNAEAAKPPMMQGSMKPSTAPERLARYEKTLTARLETVRTLKAAVDPLYASLGEEQKKTADELMIGPMGIM